MPGLALIADEFSDRVSFFTILLDFEDYKDEANRITNEANAKFITINANSSIAGSFGGLFSSGYIPETIIVDGEGNILANIVGGAPDRYRTAIESALNELGE